MEPNQSPQSQRRESILTLVLTGLAAGGALFFLVLISGGFFFYVALSAACIFAVGFLHYMLWGYAMTQEVAEEKSQADRDMRD